MDEGQNYLSPRFPLDYYAGVLHILNLDCLKISKGGVLAGILFGAMA